MSELVRMGYGIDVAARFRIHVIRVLSLIDMKTLIRMTTRIGVFRMVYVKDQNYPVCMNLDIGMVARPCFIPYELRRRIHPCGY